MSVGVEVSGGEDPYVFGVEDRFREAGEEFIFVLWEEGDGEGVDGEQGLVGGEVEGQAGRLAHREGFVKLGGESVEIACESGRRSGRVGEEEGDRSAIIDLGCDREGKGAVSIPKDAGSDVREGGCDQGRLLVLGGKRMRGVESSFGCGERLRWLSGRHTVAG